jgi:hypothetical protein
MEVAEANLIQRQLSVATRLPQDDLRFNREQVLLAANGGEVVVRTDEGLVDGILLGHVIYDLSDAPDRVRGAVDVDHTVIAHDNDLPGTGTQREIRVFLGDAVFEDLHGSVSERAGFNPLDFRFGGWPKETVNDTAEDSGSGSATSRI